MSTTIRLNFGMLFMPVLYAGSSSSINLILSGSMFGTGAEVYVIIRDNLSGAALATSGVMNAGNSYTAALNLLTEPMLNLFSGLGHDARRWLTVEVIDVHNRVMVGRGNAVCCNSSLLTGTGSVVPTVETFLTSSDFAGLVASFRNEDEIAASVEAILAILKGVPNA